MYAKKIVLIYELKTSRISRTSRHQMLGYTADGRRASLALDPTALVGVFRARSALSHPSTARCAVREVLARGPQGFTAPSGPANLLPTARSRHRCSPQG